MALRYFASYEPVHDTLASAADRSTLALSVLVRADAAVGPMLRLRHPRKSIRGENIW